jgi:SAM-dependent methyltransferase
MSNQFKEYWQSKEHSGHRFGSDDFYKMKADEIASVVNPEHQKMNCIDLGCGAGEMLFYLLDYLNIEVGLDFSESMLAKAKMRLFDQNITFINADLFEYLPNRNHEVWLTCGAINQYLNQRDQEKFLDLFAAHPNSKALYLFDCVDPIRYQVLSLGISYNANFKSRKASKIFNPYFIYAWIKQIKTCLQLGIKSPNSVCQKIGHRGKMGYGFLPKFWLSECEKRNLKVEICSSKYYEYRYHVMILK